MDLLELIKDRFSVRKFEPREVEQEKLDYILECARMAPSAVNKQPWKFIVVKSDEAKEVLRQGYNREWFATAPCYIVVVVDENESWTRACDNRNFAMVDGAIASEHICLAAASVGLGTCWVCNFDVETINNRFGLKENERVVALFPIGYSADVTPRRPGRKQLEEVYEER